MFFLSLYVVVLACFRMGLLRYTVEREYFPLSGLVGSIPHDVVHVHILQWDDKCCTTTTTTPYSRVYSKYSYNV
jgi:hypothetical protein